MVGYPRLARCTHSPRLVCALLTSFSLWRVRWVCGTGGFVYFRERDEDEIRKLKQKMREARALEQIRAIRGRSDRKLWGKLQYLLNDHGSGEHEISHRLIPTMQTLEEPESGLFLQPLQVNILSEGNGLHFDGPHSFDRPGEQFGSPTMAIRPTEIMRHPVTIEKLRRCGALSFSWMPSLGPHGAFAYFFADRAKDCFFCIDEMPTHIRETQRRGSVYE